MIDLSVIPLQDLRVMANAAREQSDFAGSERALREYVRRHPRNVDALLDLHATLLAQGLRPEAIVVARRALGAGPKDWRTHAVLAGVLGGNGQLELATRSYRTAIQLGGRNADVLTSLGELLERLHKPEEARALALEALELDPSHGPTLHLLGQVESVAGNEDAAEKWFTRAISESQRPDARATAWHRLGALREKQKRWDDAFTAHDRANRIHLNLPATRHMLATAPFEHLTHYFVDGDEEMLARWGARTFTDGPKDPVFLVGFPRSGTTMTENVLGAIPGAITSDEEPVLTSTMNLAQRMAGDPDPVDLPKALDALSHDQLVELRAEYWRSVSQRISPDAAKAPVFIDKSPLRFARALFLNLLFPKSKLIFIVRDPRDCCLSCFFQDFGISPSLVRFLTLETTGDLYDEVLTFWIRARSKLTMPWMEIKYEEMVSDFEPNARRLVEFIGREWSDDILRFNEKASNRAIRTPSYHAVTEKVNTRAVGKWAKYEKHLGPLFARVNKFLPILGYEE